MPNERVRVLFLCTGNSARSILAEAIATQRHGSTLDAASAGSAPKGTPHPLALDTLRRHGLDTDALASESWDRYRERRFDLVVTLCASAAGETCPAFPGAPLTVHWGFPDPPAAPDPAAAFERVFRTLEDAMGVLTASDDTALANRATRAASLVAARYAGTP